eukprot:8527434-Pyramimonas_sp.AAC.2
MPLAHAKQIHAATQQMVQHLDKVTPDMLFCRQSTSAISVIDAHVLSALVEEADAAEELAELAEKVGTEKRVWVDERGAAEERKGNASTAEAGESGGAAAHQIVDGVLDEVLRRVAEDAQPLEQSEREGTSSVGAVARDDSACGVLSEEVLREEADAEEPLEQRLDSDVQGVSAS